jgi:hypothetical protein
MDWITGEDFQNLGDFTYAPHNRANDDYNSLMNTLNINILKDDNIIYTHTMYVKSLFDIIRNQSKQVIIITHNSDNNIDNTYDIPINVIKWYSQNVNVINPKLESIPIGLENRWWFVEEHKKDKMLSKLSNPKIFKNLVYMNHNVNTNPKERQKPYDLFQIESWITSRIGFNGIQFDDYLDNIYNHKFVICPEGNGIDTHRTWECLYVNTIPIEKRNLNNRFYTDLPICFVNDWKEITEDFLNKEYERIINTEWNMDMLKFEYWKNKIRQL